MTFHRAGNPCALATRRDRSPYVMRLSSSAWVLAGYLTQTFVETTVLWNDGELMRWCGWRTEWLFEAGGRIAKIFEMMPEVALGCVLCLDAERLYKVDRRIGIKLGKQSLSGGEPLNLANFLLFVVIQGLLW